MPHPKTGFRHKTLYIHKQPHALHFASQRFSFWVATLTIFAFVMGNMIGQHGWYAFWKSVLGKTDDSLIVFTGTVTPIDKVPDYSKWAVYGGNPDEHQFRMVPKDLLIPLPSYVLNEQSREDGHDDFGDVYSVGNLGDYKSGADGYGSHVGTDIRVPIGTPVRSIANGIVETVRELNGGYGKYIVVRHPNVPDKSDPDNRKKITIWSIYAHLDSILVSEGQIVTKADEIGLSGKTGFATGPHLHFQIDNDQAPWHPYWPFTSAEASAAGMSFTQAINAGLHQERGKLYTLSPMLFVQQHYNPSTRTIASSAVESTEQIIEKTKLTPEERRAARKAERSKRIAVAPVTIASLETPFTSSAPTLVSTIESTEPVLPIVNVSHAAIDHIEIDHDGFFKRGWERVVIEARDANGNVVKVPSFPGKLYLRASFGDAEFRPDSLSSADFKDGRAVINVLPRGAKRSLIIETKGTYEVLSAPMELER